MAISAAVRKERIQRKIDRWPSDVVFTRPRVVQGDGTVIPEATLPPQQMRVTLDSRATVVGDSAGIAPKHALVVFAVDGADADEGYTFEHDSETYRVSKVLRIPGGLQVIATTG